MSRFYYDLHIHSCLSPCGDNDMTPGNIAGMAAVKGLKIAALTDHNTCENCVPFIKCADSLGICGICGIELTTAEEIHAVVLFEHTDAALEFSEQVKKYRMKIKNKPEIFGEQLILDENDKICGTDEFFLPAATSLGLDEAFALSQSHGGFMFPAHIDKSSNGIIAILGLMPETPDFSFVEYHDLSSKDALCTANPVLLHKKALTNSDAHLLWDISEAENALELDIEENESANEIRKKIFEYFKGKI